VSDLSWQKIEYIYSVYLGLDIFANEVLAWFEGACMIGKGRVMGMGLGGVRCKASLCRGRDGMGWSSECDLCRKKHLVLGI
jgi:hypothetical protein